MVAATIYQRPLVQGQIAFQAVDKFLVEGVKPPPAIRLSPHIVMKSNLGDRTRQGVPCASYADEIT
jgi:ABC-type sugar transport system substrate-binding protein